MRDSWLKSIVPVKEGSINASSVHQQPILHQGKPLAEWEARAYFTECVRDVFTRVYLRTGRRCDGRSADDSRPIHIDVDVYRKLHGSALFTRGQSQASAKIKNEKGELLSGLHYGHF